MAITLIGTPQAGALADGQDVTLTFDGSPQEGDAVLLLGDVGDDNGSTPFGPLTAGYDELHLFRSPSNRLSTGAWIKFLGPTPDATVTGQGTEVGTEGTAYVSYVLRGVDPTTPLDAVLVTTGPATTDDPDLNGITTVTDGAWVVAAVGSRWDSTAGLAAPSGYSNLIQAAVQDTVRASMTVATKEITSAGAENPGPFTKAMNGADWYGMTIALRPAGATTPVLAFFDLTDLPSDFGNAETAEIVVRTRGVDIGATPLKLFAQIFRSDETTPLSDEVEVAEETTDSSFANSSPVVFTGLNTTAGKSVWDGARIRFRWGM